MILGSVSVLIKFSNAESNPNYICGFSPYRLVNTHRLSYENRSVFCRVIIGLCSEIYAKHKNALCGQDTEILNVKSGT